MGIRREDRAQVPVALPAWIGSFRKKTGQNEFPTPKNPASDHDIISCPTPKVSEITSNISVLVNTKWRYYMEVNVAGDFTLGFPAIHDYRITDRYGNGLPSIIYQGKITATPVINPDLNS